MMKRKTCLGVLITLFFIAGCAKEKQNPVTPVNKPTNLLELQNLLQITSLSLESNETKSATRQAIEKTQETFSLKTKTQKQTLTAYEGFALIQGTEDIIHENYDFDSDVFDPIHEKYTSYVGLYEDQFYEIVDYVDGKENDTASKWTIGDGQNQINEEDIGFLTVMGASNFVNQYIETYFLPVLSETYTITPIDEKDGFSYYFEGDKEEQLDYGVSFHTYDITLHFTVDGFLSSYIFNYSLTAQDYDANNQLGEPYTAYSLQDTVQITRGKKATAPQTLEIIPTDYWMSDYEIQLQARYVNESFDCEANQLPMDYYIDAKVSSTVPEKAIDTQLTIIDSSNQDVISVDEFHTAKTVGIGTTTLTIRSESGIEKTIQATVVSQAAQEITLNIYSSTFYVGESYNIFLTVKPDNAVDEYQFEVSNTNAEILYDEDNDPVLHCLAAGEVTITVKSKANPNIKDTLTITITKILTIEEVQANIIGTWKDVDVEGQTITFNDDFSGSFYYWDASTKEFSTYTFTWSYQTLPEGNEDLVVSVSEMGSWNDNLCYFSMDGQSLRIYFTNIDIFYDAVSGDFIKES